MKYIRTPLMAIFAFSLLINGSSAIAYESAGTAGSNGPAAEQPQLPPAPELTTAEAFTGNWAKEFQYTMTVGVAFKTVVERFRAAGYKLRGTHSKGLCANGELTLDEEFSGMPADIAAALADSELFRARGSRFPVHARHSNGGTGVSPDSAKDVRSLSLAIDLGDGKRQDFTFNNSPRFQIPNIRSFAALMFFSGVKQQLPAEMSEEEKEAVAASKTIQHFGEGPGILAELPSIREMAATDTGYADRYSNQSYYSGTPFYIPTQSAQAPGEVKVSQYAKVGAYPCSYGDVSNSEDLGNGTLTQAEAEAKSPNYLGEGFLEDLSKDEAVCYRLYVQFLTDAEGYEQKPGRAQSIIENAAYIWKGKIYNVGKVYLNAPVAQETCDSPEKAISPNVNAHWVRGAGSINRGRYFAESFSAKARAAAQE